MVIGYETEDPLFESGFKWISIKLAAVITFIFVLQLIYPPLTDMFSEIPSRIFFEPWRIITHIFLHSTTNITHIFYNMFGLVLFGAILEKIVGWRRFLTIFFIAGIVASIGSIVVSFLQGTQNIPSIGASGAIFGVIGALAVLRPRMIVYVLYFPMPMIAAAFFWALIDIIGLFNPFDYINNSAHLFGMFFGIVFALAIRQRFGEPFFVKKRSADIHIKEEEFEDWEERWMGRKKKKRE
ncbi:TPA: rhomboid family intramembrane serine protease [archaeon]|uniref:Rhomboid family intramembrane serine protease n=1 Tax=Candidatus Naiadarchaeum limnaeum TaxID=2756139 RepID=A0A832V1F4_9ARCH|nr:rhomboid family intramembrane serine protease [Candidatus Naiadarchaeum limnaeum]